MENKDKKSERNKAKFIEMARAGAQNPTYDPVFTEQIEALGWERKSSKNIP